MEGLQHRVHHRQGRRQAPNRLPVEAGRQDVGRLLGGCEAHVKGGGVGDARDGERDGDVVGGYGD